MGEIWSRYDAGDLSRTSGAVFVISVMFTDATIGVEHSKGSSFATRWNRDAARDQMSTPNDALVGSMNISGAAYAGVLRKHDAKSVCDEEYSWS
jgi:hypothetical protein